MMPLGVEYPNPPQGDTEFAQQIPVQRRQLSTFLSQDSLSFEMVLLHHIRKQERYIIEQRSDKT